MRRSREDRAADEAFADELMLQFGLDDPSDLELVPPRPAVGFGGAAALPSRVEASAAARFGKGSGNLASLVGILGQGFIQGGTPDQWANLVVRSPPPPSPFLPSSPSSLPARSVQSSVQSVARAPVAPVSPQVPPRIVSDASTLPPVYVSDVPGAAKVDASASSSLTTEPVLRPSPSFGASFDLGSVRPRSTDEERTAVIRARLEGSRAVSRASRGRETPFVEDPLATPLLLSDGQILDPYYGSMSLVPCPSCSHVPEFSYGGSGSGCVVCDDWGGVIVPSSDVSSWSAPDRYSFRAATVSFGFLPLLLALAPAVAPILGAAGGKVLGGKQQEQADLATRAAAVRAKLRKEVEGIDDSAQPSSSLTSTLPGPVSPPSSLPSSAPASPSAPPAFGLEPVEEDFDEYEIDEDDEDEDLDDEYGLDDGEDDFDDEYGLDGDDEDDEDEDEYGLDEDEEEDDLEEEDLEPGHRGLAFFRLLVPSS